MKDGGDISFQCGDVKDSCKVTVRECELLFVSSFEEKNEIFNGFFSGEKAPRIDASRFPKSVTIKAGRPLDLEIPFEAYPAPTAIWTKDGRPIQTGGDNPCQTALDPKKSKLTM